MVESPNSGVVPLTVVKQFDTSSTNTARSDALSDDEFIIYKRRQIDSVRVISKREENEFHSTGKMKQGALFAGFTD